MVYSQLGALRTDPLNLSDRQFNGGPVWRLRTCRRDRIDRMPTLAPGSAGR